MPPPLDRLVSRLERARRAVGAAAIDTLLVTAPSNIAYLIGIRMSAGAVLLTADDAVVIADGRYAAAAAAIVGEMPGVRLRPLATGESYEEAIGTAVSGRGWSRVGVEAGHLSLARFGAVRRAAGEAGSRDWVETDGLIEALRAEKDAWEVAVLRDAAGRLSAVAACILPQVSAGLTERQVAWDIEVALHSAGFERPAFETIVASGPHAARPHHRPSARRLETGELVLLDFGGVLDGYAVDMSRTVALGTVGADERRWLTAVSDAHAAAIAATAPGRRPSEVDGAARQVLADAGLGDLFLHGTGHGLGLDIHERPMIGPRGDATGPLAPGMVFTIEPGVYAAGRGGVRIEDDVLVTATGVERLTF